MKRLKRSSVAFLVAMLMLGLDPTRICAQELDISMPYAYFQSHINHAAQSEDFNFYPHNIFVDFKQHEIWIENDEDCKTLYQLSFNRVYQEGDESIKLKEGETLFFIDDDQIEFVIYQEGEGVLSVISKTDDAMLFGDFETEESILKQERHHAGKLYEMTGINKEKDGSTE